VSTFTQLGDRYDVGQVIGRGGMAEVYEGTDRRLNRRVAIKVLRPDLARDPMFQERFRREARSAAGLNHPNIVAIYDTGEDLIGEGANQVSVPYIVMEFVDGVTLRHMLNNGPRILPERALEIIAGVLAALDYAHRHGIVHRDIKPANIMISTNGDAKVMDFGIARAMSDAATSVTATSAVMGTAQYLSPEQARGELVDARSDIYSSGCVLYELLTGVTPFSGDSPVSIAYQHVNEPPKPPSSLDNSIPSSLDSITLGALAKSPSNRYQTAAEMRSDVERSIAGMPIMSRQSHATDVTIDNALTAAIPIIDGFPGGIAVAPPKVVNKRSRWLFAGFATVLAASLMFLLGDNLFGSGPETVPVPNVKALTVEEATLALTQAGLQVGTQTPQADDNAPKGTIIGQDPAAGELIEAGQAVNLIVSAGKDQTGVPDLVGLTSSEDARLALTEARLVLGKVTPVDSDKPEGTVIEQDPAANSSVDVGTLVSITVSSGKVPVPNVVGANQTDAKNTLLNAGFLVEVVFEDNGAVAENTVIAQNPIAETVTLKGTTVVIKVSRLPIVVAPTPTQTPAQSPSPTPTTTTP
jgi:beta-lactam-binding protein with PASTA domain/tRNA A-37 threonylcarbamoyl transferase component Bud32